MSLLREIQEAAVDAHTPLTVVLRKCMVLAARLGHEPFKKWVEQELSGYPPDADLPEYRRLSDLISVGSFAGPLGRQLVNVPLSLGPVPDHARHHYETAEFREGVAKLADMATIEKIGARWPGELIAFVGDKYYQGYVLLEAHIEIPRSAVVGVLDSIRNKVLKFALEIELQNPAAGDVAAGTTPVPEARVAQIFNTYIMGDAQNVAVGSPGAVQHAQQLQAGDVAGLKRFLAGQGVEHADLDELDRAIAQDPKPKEGKPFGQRVAGWMGTMVSKAASGAWKISTSAATEILSAALKAYYGLL